MFWLWMHPLVRVSGLMAEKIPAVLPAVGGVKLGNTKTPAIGGVATIGGIEKEKKIAPADGGDEQTIVPAIGGIKKEKKIAPRQRSAGNDVVSDDDSYSYYSEEEEHPRIAAVDAEPQSVSDSDSSYTPAWKRRRVGEAHRHHSLAAHAISPAAFGSASTISVRSKDQIFVAATFTPRGSCKAVARLTRCL